MKVIRITAPHFVAGVGIHNGRVVLTAPILSYMKGWTRERVLAHVERKGWKLDERSL